jgi:sarcosine oxidase, subunit alpha
LAQKNLRVNDHPVLGRSSDRRSLTFIFDGISFAAFEGETIAAALIANGVRALRQSNRNGTPRGIYCAIGHCYECRVRVNSVSGTRACLTPVSEGMVVESSAGSGKGHSS